MFRFAFTSVLLVSCLGLQAQPNVQPSYLTSYFQAKGALVQKHYAQAISLLDTAIALKLPEMDAMQLKGDVGLASGDLKNAEACYLRVEAIRPGMAAVDLARVYSLEGKDSVACEWLYRSLTYKYKELQSTYLLDKTLQKMENSPYWRKLWDGDYYNKNEQLEADMTYLINTGNNTEALDLVQEKAEKHKLRHQQEALMGKAYYQLRSYSAAIDAYSRAIKRSSHNAGYYYLRAQAYLDDNKSTKALDDINKAIELDPLNPDFYLIRAKASVGAKLFDQSRADFGLYIMAHGNNPETLYDYAIAMYEAGYYLEALRQINQCILLKADNAAYYIARGNIYMKTNSYKYAIQDYAMALDLGQPSAEVYLLKGYARSANGDEQGACSDWKKAASMGSLDAQSMVARYCR